MFKRVLLCYDSTEAGRRALPAWLMNRPDIGNC
jgi:hypothetical protein